MASDTSDPVQLTAKRADRPDPDRDLVILASKALRLLGEAGRPAEAGALAGKMWWSLKDDDPDGAARLNGVMHYLAKLEAAAGSPTGSGTASAAEPELDAQAISPAVRHETILQTFTDLAPGTAFILVNSHDPKPLRYQFEAEHAGQFTWDYVETGPEVWKIRVGRPAA